MTYQQKIANYLPKTEQGKILLELMKESEKLLKDHPINKDRIKRFESCKLHLALGEGESLILTAFITSTS